MLICQLLNTDLYRDFSWAILVLFLRFTGTIVGIEDLSSQWKDSTWRSLKVDIVNIVG